MANLMSMRKTSTCGTNFGGDKVWPNQQSEFVKINGHSWPPDHAFDGAVHEVELLPEGVR